MIEKKRKPKHRHEWEKCEIGEMKYIKCKTCNKVSFPGQPALKIKGAFGNRKPFVMGSSMKEWKEKISKRKKKR